MRVMFLQNIKGVAQIGDIKSVSDGYARNFLFSKKLAIAVTPEIEKQSKILKSKREKQYGTDKESSEKLAEKLKGVAIELREDANSEGHLYASVNEKKIAHALREQGIVIKEEHINLPQHLKAVGEHEVELDLYPEVKVKIKVIIISNKKSA